ncbi:anti-anti-sigma factor Rsfb [Mycolicibacterium canariasense]|uniref:Anti-sigma factor antagonist n=1 Tax=Mycolicibacterium canariasense TaxID=228230 RepID=A0A124E1G4_MYCCR|nr:STAS domain-containing protein [Mycolicibacterium canariasense]MCV7213326.1 STAS domain-containing protein [Mycolicibacterium canariasense]ORV10576.1 anti-anti-sigma factor [Mycolicibacterium canariasense]GAS93633.1 anti-anti-sigma factor Rsfb [Mycolicibacterium canariasense]
MSPDPATCTIDERRIGAVTVLAVTGTVDMITSPQLEAALTAAIAETPQAIIVDLSAVDFLASTGMGVLVAAHDALPAGIRFAVVADGPATSRPLDLIGFAGVLGVVPTLDAALSAVTG